LGLGLGQEAVLTLQAPARGRGRPTGGFRPHPDGSLVGLPFLVGCAGVRKWLWECGEKSQASLNSQPARNRDAICAIFLLGGFADTQFAWPYCHRVIRELVF